MLRELSIHDALELQEFFRASDYTLEGMRRTLITSELTSLRLRNLPLLLHRTKEVTPHNVLLRWFAVGVPVDVSTTQAVIPDRITDLLTQCGLLVRQDDALVSIGMLNPFEQMLIAADHSVAIEGGVQTDVVLGLNATTWLLHRFTIRRPGRLTLDLGCGSGAQALAATRHSERVVATDLNPRALTFMRFNASLNGCSDKIEVLGGDRLEPVEGREFDLIVANPPFFVTPSSNYLYCENQFELDDFCRRLVVDSPRYLKPGGVFQMVFEWVEVEGETWTDRLTGWLQATGCDAVIYKSYTEDLGRYAIERIRGTVDHTPEHDSDLFREWMSYYEKKRLKAIHGGLLAMRRRSGTNWIRFEELSSLPKENFGDAVGGVFDARDTLDRFNDNQSLLDAIPMLSPHVRLDQQFKHSEGSWHRIVLQLSLVHGLSSIQRLEPLVAEFLSHFDGHRSLRQITEDVAAHVNAPLDQVQQECLNATRLMVQRGFVEAKQQKS